MGLLASLSLLLWLWAIWPIVSTTCLTYLILFTEALDLNQVVGSLCYR